MESDLSLINKIKEENNGDCLEELINRHSGIYIYIVDKYTKNKSYVTNRDFILDDKDYMIYQSALSYKPEKNSKFSTFLANQTKWKCLNAINSSKNKPTTDIDRVYGKISEQDDSYEIVCKMEAFDCFDNLLKKEKDGRVKKIIDIRYNTTNTRLVPWRVVSKELNLSIQGCINIHNKFIKKVKQQFDNNYV
jgi:hypothetical protein